MSACLFALSWLDMICCANQEYSLVRMMFATAGSLCKTYATPNLQDKLKVAEVCGLSASKQQVRALCNDCYLSVVNGKFCQKQMPLYSTVCRNPSAALSDIKSSACPLPDCILAFLACTF